MTTTVPRPALELHGVSDTLLRRIRGEFLEMPGLKLTMRQAMRLWHLDAETCEIVLQALVQHQFLRETAYGAFLRAES